MTVPLSHSQLEEAGAMWLDEFNTAEIAHALGVPESLIWAIEKPKPQPKVVPFTKAKAK